MPNWRRAGAAGLFVAIAIGVVTTGLAWPCAPQPWIGLSPQASGTAGQTVTIQGVNFSGPVEIRWNALDGPQLATPDGTEFRTPIVIPKVADGLYTVVAVQRRSDGVVASVASASLQVGAAASAAPEARAAAPAMATTKESPSWGRLFGAAVAGATLVLLALAIVSWLPRRHRTAADR